MDIDSPCMEIAKYVVATADADVATRIDISMNGTIFMDRDVFSPDASE
jgi:hypothetical protein